MDREVKVVISHTDTDSVSVLISYRLLIAGTTGSGGVIPPAMLDEARVPKFYLEALGACGATHSSTLPHTALGWFGLVSSVSSCFCGPMCVSVLRVLVYMLVCMVAMVVFVVRLCCEGYLGTGSLSVMRTVVVHVPYVLSYR